MSIINTYAPTEDATAEDKIEHHEQLQEISENILRNDIVIITRDFSML